MATEKCEESAHEASHEEDVLTHKITDIIGQSLPPQELICELVAFINSREIELQSNRAGQRADIESLYMQPAKRELYADRNNPKEGPIEFLRRVWPESLNAELYQFQLRKADYQLFVAVRNWGQRNGKSVSDILPPKSAYIDKWLLDNATLAIEIGRLYHAVRRRKTKK